MDEYEDLLTNNRIWIGRTKGIGFISIEDMLDLGVTGPDAARRGSEDRHPQGRSRTPATRSSISKCPTRTENDVYARYQVRIEEMRQSARIVRQALEGMPAGRLKADAPHVVLPDREKMKTQMEALIYHFKIVTEGFRVPAGEVYQVIESPRGEAGLLHRERRHGQALPRAHADAELRQSAGNLYNGGRHLIADVIASIGSMDFVLGDTDR